MASIRNTTRALQYQTPTPSRRSVSQVCTITPTTAFLTSSLNIEHHFLPSILQLSLPNFLLHSHQHHQPQHPHISLTKTDCSRTNSRTSSWRKQDGDRAALLAINHQFTRCATPLHQPQERRRVRWRQPHHHYGVGPLLKASHQHHSMDQTLLDLRQLLLNQ